MFWFLGSISLLASSFRTSDASLDRVNETKQLFKTHVSADFSSMNRKSAISVFFRVSSVFVAYKPAERRIFFVVHKYAASTFFSLARLKWR